MDAPHRKAVIWREPSRDFDLGWHSLQCNSSQHGSRIYCHRRFSTMHSMVNKAGRPSGHYWDCCSGALYLSQNTEVWKPADFIYRCVSRWPCRQNSTVLQWRHNGRDGVSNHRRLDCFLIRLFRRRSKKTPKLRVTGICEGNSPVTGEFPAQTASNVENVSIWWRHHDIWNKWHVTITSQWIIMSLSTPV